jgi:CheY-like chemotaxis protein
VVNQQLAVALLARVGHTVHVVSNGQEAVDAVRSQPFDLVLMDVQMPELDGFAATQAIRHLEQQDAARPHLPIVAMTAHAMKGDKERCLAAGMDDYISKPIRSQLLYEKVYRLFPHGDSGQPGDLRAELGEVTVDWGQVAAYVQHDPNLFREVCRSFLDEVPRKLAEIGQAITDGDATLLVRAARGLRGSIGFFSGNSLGQLAAELEFRGRSADLSKAGDLLAALTVALERLRTLIDKRLTADGPETPTIPCHPIETGG